MVAGLQQGRHGADRRHARRECEAGLAALDGGEVGLERRAVGFWVRALASLVLPSASCTYVEVWKIGVMMAPVPDPPGRRMQMVEKCSRPESFTTGMLSFAH